MLSLHVYNSSRTGAERLLSKCSSYIKSSGQKLKTGIACDEAAVSTILSSLDDSALFMLKKDGSLVRISECIDLSDHDNYIVLVFEKADDMFDAVSPAVRPSGLLLESFDEKRVGKIIDEVYADYLRSHEECRSDYHFRIKGIDYSASFSNIVLIEVQSKKIKFHTSAQTYEFYDSLDAVMKEAPDYFIRIHRSYVINANFIKSVNYREKIITLNDDSTLFFSRNYIREIKDYYIRIIKENLDG